MRRLLSLAALGLFLVPELAHAQLGGIRRRATEALQPKPQQAQAQQMVVVPLTNEVLTQYIKGLEGRREAMRALARENSSIGRYFRAVLVRDSLERREMDFRAETGPDWEKHQQLQAAMQRGDMNAYQESQRLQQERDPNKVEIPEADWNAQRQANGRLDSAAVIAGGFNSLGEWGYVNDKIPPVVSRLSWGNVTDDTAFASIAQSNNISPAEVKVVQARRIELARAAGLQYRTDAQVARERDQKKQENQQADATNTYNGCMATEMKPIFDEADRRKTELEQAQQNGDVNKLMEFANRVQAAQTAAAQKCAPLLNQ